VRHHYRLHPQKQPAQPQSPLREREHPPRPPPLPQRLCRGRP